MEGASAAEKRDSTITTPKNPSRPSSRSSNHKRQRTDPKKAMESSADFISLDFSDGADDEPVEVEYIGTRRSKRTPLASGNTTSVTSKSSGTQDEDDQEGGVEEKTAAKRKRKRKLPMKLPKEGENGAEQEVNRSEQPTAPSLHSRGDSSDEDGGISIRTPSDGTHILQDDESEIEDEDKDSSTRRALSAKKLNGARTPGQEDAPKPESVEIAIATASNPKVSNVLEPAIKELEKDPAIADGKAKKRKPRKKKSVAEAERSAQIELPKGGGFKNISDRKDDDDTSASSLGDEDDDEGLEIHVDLDMVDIGDNVKAISNHISDEEGEVVETLAQKADLVVTGANEDGDGGDSPLVDQAVAMRQRKYYSAYVPPPFRLEEARPFFGSTSGVDFTADVKQERELAAVMATAFSESKKICSICTKIGHSEDNCQELKCKHCGSWNKHFSHACPDAEKDEDEEAPRVIDHWRRIPAHRHKPIQQKKSLPIHCYLCAGSDHYGDDCPRCPPPQICGSFSLSEINVNSYATQEWLLESGDILEALGSGKGNPTFGVAGTKMTTKPTLDPFRDMRNFDKEDPFPKRAPPAGPSRGKDSYKSRSAQRGGNGASYRQRSRSPHRDSIFDRYRQPLPPRPTHGLPPRPRSRSRSPLRIRNNGGRGGGGIGRGGGGGRGGARMYGPPGDFHNRPAARESRKGYESRAQPPLPREPAPRRTEEYRPMPSSARGNWQKYKT